MLPGYGHFTTFLLEPPNRVRGLTFHRARLAEGHRTLFGRALPTGLVDGLSCTEPTIVKVTLYDDDVEVTTRPVPTSAPMSCDFFPLTRNLPRVKHLGLAPQWYAQKHVDADDAILVTDDTITEGSMFNVAFITPDGALEWPVGDVLLGTTQQLIERIWPSTRREIHTCELGRYIGAIGTNAARGVRLITRIGHDFTTSEAGCEVARDIARAYMEIPRDALTSLN